jgi:hypothetical protein
VRHQSTSCITVAANCNPINNNNVISQMFAIHPQPDCASSPGRLPSSGVIRDERLEREARRTLAPWTGKLTFSNASPSDHRAIRGSDERSEGYDSSSDGIAEIDDSLCEEGKEQEIRVIQDYKTSVEKCNDQTTTSSSTLLINQIIDLTLSPSPPPASQRRPVIDMRTPVRSRAVARYASPECYTAMSPLRGRLRTTQAVQQTYNSPVKPNSSTAAFSTSSKTLHPFFDPSVLANSQPRESASSSQAPPPLAHVPRLSMRTIQPGSQSTESASGSQGTTTSTSTYATSESSPGSYRRPIQTLRGLQNSRVMIEERVSRHERPLSWFRGKGAQREKIAEVPDELVLDFDALKIDEGTKTALGMRPKKDARSKDLHAEESPSFKPKSDEPEPMPREPYVPKRKITQEFFDVPNLPIFSYKTFIPTGPALADVEPKRYVPPTLVYTACADEADDLIPLLQGDVVGFDMEWPVNYRRFKGAASAQYLPGQTALVQVCDDKMVLLLHLSKMNCEFGQGLNSSRAFQLTPHPVSAIRSAFPSALKDLCNSETIFKIGVNINGAYHLRSYDRLSCLTDILSAGDSKKLIKDFPFLKPKLMLDLSYVARQVDPTNCGDAHVLISLARLTRAYLGYDLDKDSAVRTSDWSLNLSKEQQECEWPISM